MRTTGATTETPTASISDFLVARARDESDQHVFAVAKLHVPAPCGRHCDGHVDESPVWPCLELRAVAAAYAEHPDYRDDWRP